MEVYLRDNLTMETFDIKNGAFEVQLEAGEYHDKYSIVFQSNAAISNEEEQVLQTSLRVYVNGDGSLIFVKNLDFISSNSFNLDVSCFSS